MNDDIKAEIATAMAILEDACTFRVGDEIAICYDIVELNKEGRQQLAARKGDIAKIVAIKGDEHKVIFNDYGGDVYCLSAKAMRKLQT